VVSRSGRVVVVGVKDYDVEKNEGRETVHRLVGKEWRALTDPELSSSAPSISPDDTRLAFVRKKGEHAQLHVMPLDGGEARKLSDFPLGCDDPKWLPDGRHVIVVAPLYREALTLEGTRALAEKRKTQKVKAHVTEDRVYRFWDRWLTDGAVPHLFVVDVETGAARDLVPDSERWFDLMDDPGQYDVSPDGKEVVFAANESAPPHDRTRWAIFAAPVEGGPTRHLTQGNPADDVRPRYSPDGRFIAFGSRRDDYYGDRVRLVLLDRKTGAQKVVTETWDRSPTEWEWADAKTLVGSVDDQARALVFTLSIDGGEPKLLTDAGTAHGIVPAGGAIHFQHQSLTRPPEIAVLRGNGLERISSFNDALLSELSLSQPETYRFEGASGEEVQAYLLKPAGFDPSKKHPLVHMIHGGPYGTFGDAWSFRWNAQTIVAQGYVVTMVNFHGSSSFGEKFARSILGDWGGKPAEDILRATDHLLARGFVDEKRMAITGGSYGGYMTCWLATQTDRFACAIAHAAVFNLSSLYGSDVTQGSDLEFGAVPWGDESARALFSRWDPARFTHNYVTPMLVIHGELDYRVPVTNGLEVYGILKAKGVPARLVYYPDENHWILKPQNSLHWYGEFLGWLKKYLSTPSAP
jgi:dipeptidyl aminopeptidase/acylaminoacyl peptidase